MVAQGVTTFTINPANPNQAINQAWIDDIKQLATPETGPLMMRANVVANPTDNSLAIPQYGQAFQLYNNPQGNNMAVHAVLPREFDYPGNRFNQNQLPQYLTSPYIDDFSFRADNFAGQMKGYANLSYFIWNEPNNTGQANALPAQVFGALLYQCYNRIKNDQHINGFIYMGGLLWPFAPAQGRDATYATNQVVTYLTDVYNYLLDNSVGAAFGNQIPWDALTVHPHDCAKSGSQYPTCPGYWTDQDMADLRAGIDNVFNPSVNTHPNVNPADRRGVYVGEWGITHGETNNTDGVTCMLNTFTSIRNHFDAMWYFQHPDSVNTGCSNTAAYGLTQWGLPGNYYTIGTRCPEWDQLHYVLQYPSP